MKKALKIDLIQGKCENIDQGQCQKYDTVAVPETAGEKKYLLLQDQASSYYEFILDFPR